MKALRDDWCMTHEGMLHSWTTGKDYRIRDNGNVVVVVSDAGTQRIPKECCDPALFKAIFGMTI